MQDRISRQNLKVRLPMISCALLSAAVLTLALKLAEITGHPAPWMLLAWMIGLSASGTVILFALAGTTNQQTNVRPKTK